jgi:uncharacterized protein (UPF0303 family)
VTDLITTLHRQEQELVFESFDHTDAWVGVVTAATASGLSSQEDHDLIVEGIRADLADRGSK